MGKITYRRADGATGEVRTSVKTKHVRLAHENPVAVDLSAIGDTPALAEMSLTYKTTLETFDAPQTWRLLACIGRSAIAFTRTCSKSDARSTARRLSPRWGDNWRPGTAPREVLQDRLHRAIEAARDQLANRSERDPAK